MAYRRDARCRVRSLHVIPNRHAQHTERAGQFTGAGSGREAKV